MSPAGALKGLECNRDDRAGTFGDLVTCERCLDLDRNGGTTHGETMTRAPRGRMGFDSLTL
jgi:hypothetical protein